MEHYHTAQALRSLEKNDMSDIPERQNQPDALQYLAAQRQLYDEDKRWTLIWFIVTVGVAILGTGALFIFVSYVALITWILLVITLAELFLLPSTRNQRVNAAGIQELFDCQVLDLEWNDALADRPDPKVIELAVERFNKRKDHDLAWEDLRDWYESPAISTATMTEARLICQRENIVWDAKQRSQLFNRLVAVTGGFVAILVAVTVILHWRIDQLLSGPILLIIPLIVALMRYASEHRTAAERLGRLQAVVNAILKDAGRPYADNVNITQQTRNVQNEIYRHRRDYVPVPNWIFEKFRKKNSPPSAEQNERE